MLQEELVFIGTCDIGGLVRGKGFPASELKRRKKWVSQTRIRPRRNEAMQATWRPYTEHGDLTTRSNLPDSVYAFPKEPLTDASMCATR
jgi:hypothetical protein